jgi:hypothetical protein
MEIHGIRSRMATLAKKAAKLRAAVRRSLRAQGFKIAGDRVGFRQKRDKRSVRKRHIHAVAKKIQLAQASLAPVEDELLKWIASGSEVDPRRIRPRLTIIKPDTLESQMFRYACLHWSIPISEGYGRRLRFLIIDESNKKLIGVLGLGDPVYAIQARDKWIGWEKEAKAEKLYHVMDAYVLGAVPPYSYLLGAKLVALTAASDEVRRAFKRRYANRTSLILGKKRKPHLVLLTTTSALGRSSIYNRVRFRKRLVFCSVGFTGGWGEFHFSDGVYERLSAFADRYCEPTAKQKKWGVGFRNRRELVRKALPKMGLSADWLNHGIQREVFVVPLARNTKSFLRGESQTPHYFGLPFESAVRFWKKRWLMPRAARDQRYREFKASSYRLWPKKKENDAV